MNRYRLILHLALTVSLLLSGIAAVAHASGEHPAGAVGSGCTHVTRQTAGDDAVHKAPVDPDPEDPPVGHGLDHIGCGGTAHPLPTSMSGIALSRSLPPPRPQAEHLTSRTISPDPYPPKARHRL